MTNEDSPVIDFYPTDFASDLNGKLQEWEAVVLIPFIQEVCIFKINSNPIVLRQPKMLCSL